MNTSYNGAATNSTAAVAENTDPSRTREAIRRVVELSGGMDWLEPGQTVVIKPSLNSTEQFPFTSSPASCAELVRMCLEKGATTVYVADATQITVTGGPDGTDRPFCQSNLQPGSCCA